MRSDSCLKFVFHIHAVIFNATGWACDNETISFTDGLDLSSSGQYFYRAEVDAKDGWLIDNSAFENGSDSSDPRALRVSYPSGPGDAAQFIEQFYLLDYGQESIKLTTDNQWLGFDRVHLFSFMRFMLDDDYEMVMNGSTTDSCQGGSLQTEDLFPEPPQMLGAEVRGTVLHLSLPQLPSPIDYFYNIMAVPLTGGDIVRLKFPERPPFSALSRSRRQASDAGQLVNVSFNNLNSMSTYEVWVQLCRNPTSTASASCGGWAEKYVANTGSRSEASDIPPSNQPPGPGEDLASFYIGKGVQPIVHGLRGVAPGFQVARPFPVRVRFETFLLQVGRFNDLASY